MLLQDVIGRYTALEPSGSEYVGWHQAHESSSKTSLHVDPKKQLWYCFHCNRGGDVYDWIGDMLYGRGYDRHRHFREIKLMVDEGKLPPGSLPPAPLPPVMDRAEPDPNIDFSIYKEYHQQVKGEYWYHELGNPKLIDPAIDHFQLGYCPSHPGTGLPSHTMPVFVNGKCVNIRHRLIGNTKDKYRPHAAGLGATIYNYDALEIARQSKRVLLLAGEKKVIAAWARGMREVISSTIGCSFKEEWAELLYGIDRRYILFDPGEEEAADKVAGIINGKVIHLDQKLDDWFVSGHNIRELVEILHQAIEIDEDYWSRRLNLPLWQPR